MRFFRLYTHRQLSRKAVTSAAQRPGAETAKNAGPPIRRHSGTVAISSGPPPIKSKAKEKSNGHHNDQPQAEDRIVSGSTDSPATNGTPGGSGTAGGSDSNGKSVSAAGHTHDKGYEKWTKFDVDAALREVDAEKNGSEKARF